MTNEELNQALAAFTKENKFARKGPLCVALVMTQHARTSGLPLDRGEPAHRSKRSGAGPRQECCSSRLGPARHHARSRRRRPDKSRRCRDNLDDGYRPVLVTMQRGLTVAEALADNAGIADRIDVFEIEQFVALNLYELGKFAAEGRKVAVAELVNRYNEIIDDVETDPSMKIDFKQ